MFSRLEEKVLVAGQIGPEDIADAARYGVTTIINNRPDGEESGQPASASIEAAARSAGLDYHHIPVAGGLSPTEVSQAAAAVQSASGEILFFCRSGTRSTFLWALMRAAQGVDGRILADQAAAAGYDLSPLFPHLRG